MFFRLGLSGLNAASSDLETTSNNIANANTFGFKSSRAEFADVFAVSGDAVSQTAIGNGVRLASVDQLFSQGNIKSTSNNLDLAISGSGFFTVRDSKGLEYTRAGAFSPNSDGEVVNSQGQHLQVFPPLGNGRFDTSTMSNLKLSTAENPPAATRNADIGINLPSDATPPANTTFDSTDPTSYNDTTSLTVYDSLGATHTASLYFVKDAAQNSWQAHLYVDGKADGVAQNLVFDSNGALTSPANGQLTFPPYDAGSGAAPLNMKLDFSDATQYGNKFAVNALTQDGHATGRLSGIDIGQDGVVSARYTNGEAQPLGKVALTNFANPDGLQQLGNTTWGETYTSGEALHGTAGTANFGLIQSGALEGSNVNLTAQLVNMIQAQRNFQANAKVISTANNVTQAVMSIRA
jgi:flagellar hook protein FlgE